ncbi:MAG: hypothetical protein EBT08_18905, partial [Betaproteobacteria bacterium]|nr:hypothetical protein [Betaproteobacteria bacterium]
MSRIRTFLLSAIVLGIAGTAGYQAIGGRVGATLLWVKLWMRVDYPETREVQWQAGPTEAQSTGSGARPPNVILIVADD